jgi:hypothetical protein
MSFFQVLALIFSEISYFAMIRKVFQSTWKTVFLILLFGSSGNENLKKLKFTLSMKSGQTDGILNLKI